MDEDAIRNVMADQMACGFIVELLLTDYIKRMPYEMRDFLVGVMRETGRRTDQLTGLASSDTKAELLADVTVRMHGALDDYIDRALTRLAAGEAAGL